MHVRQRRTQRHVLVQLVLHRDEGQHGIVGKRLGVFEEQVLAALAGIGQVTVGGQVLVIDERAGIAVFCITPVSISAPNRRVLKLPNDA